MTVTRSRNAGFHGVRGDARRSGAAVLRRQPAEDWLDAVECLWRRAYAIALGAALGVLACSSSDDPFLEPGSLPSPPAPITAIAIAPGENIQAKVDANPAGTTFLLKEGTHVRQSVVPKDGNVFRGERGTVLDGQNVTAFAFKGSERNALG